MSKEEPLVSVAVFTYQHAAFIDKCIRGILTQRTDFPFEVLIGEDESTDGTREICQRIAGEEPERVRLFLRSRKDVIHVHGRPTGRFNLMRTLEAAHGKYIALCEGDDHWTDPLKLQKQVDAMEADPNAVGCFTDAVIHGDGPPRPFFDGVNFIKPTGPVDLNAFMRGQGIPVCTMLFRTGRLFPLPGQITRGYGADTILFAHLLRKGGHYRYLDAPTAVRLIQPGGVYSMKSDAFKIWARLTSMALVAEMYRGHAALEHLRPRQAKLALKGWAMAMELGDRKLAELCWRTLAPMRDRAGWTLPTTVRNYLKFRFPILERLLAQVLGR